MTQKNQHIRLSADNIESGRFHETISILSPQQLGSFHNKEYIETFLDYLIDLNKQNFNVKYVDQNGQTYPTILKKSSAQLEYTLDSKNNFSSSNGLIYFKYLYSTYIIFTSLNESGSFNISSIYELKRRFWFRYPIHSKSSVNIQSDSESIVAEAKNISLNGLLLKCQTLNHIELFETITLLFEDQLFNAQIVHINDLNQNIGIQILQEDLKRFKKLYLKTISQSDFNITSDKHQIQQNTLKKTFQTAVFPQSYSEDYLSLNERGKIFLLHEEESYSSGICYNKLNSKSSLIHTLLISPKHFNHLPVKLYEYMANAIFSDFELEYFCGYWPSNNKYLDRGYTNFITTHPEKEKSHFEQISIYKCKNEDQWFEQKSKYVCFETSLEELSKKEKSFIVSLCSPVFFNAFFDKSSKIFLCKDSNLNPVAFGLCIPKKSNIPVFGLDHQAWLYIDKRQLDNKQTILISLLKSFQNYFKSQDSSADFFNTHMQEFDPEFVKNTFVESCAKNIYFWISPLYKAKAYIKYLERIRFEHTLLSDSKNKVNLRFARYFKNFNFKHFKRQSLRYSPSKKEIHANIQYKNESIKISHINNIDSFGASLAIPANRFFEKDDALQLKIQINEQSCFVEAKVTYCKTSTQSGFSHIHTILGLEFINQTAESINLIKEHCFRQLNPNLNMFQKKDFKALVELLDKSKYFEYYDSTRKSQFEKESYDTYTSLNLMIPNHARVTVFKTEDENIIGSHAFYKRAKKTWQLHQLAVDEDLRTYKKHIPTKIVLNGAFKYLCLDPDAEYFITYFHNDAAIAKTYFNVKDQHEDKQDHECIPFIGYLFENLKNETLKFDNNIQEINNNFNTYIQNYLKNEITDMEFKALDYKDLKQTVFIENWNKDKPQRERKTLIYNDQNQITCMAICDISPIGINFIGLVDIFKIYILNKEHPNIQLHLQSLTNYVKYIYSSYSRTQAYLEIQMQDEPYFKNISARHLGHNWRLIGSRKTFITALNSFNQRFERLEQRLRNKGKL